MWRLNHDLKARGRLGGIIATYGGLKNLTVSFPRLLNLVKHTPRLPCAGKKTHFADMGRRKGTTAFPIARIKKIMQSDDDVGKIATNTPALVGKALECLMEDLLRDSAAVALQRRAKTLTPSHIKASVGGRAQFDFLRPLVANVPDVADTVDAKPKRPRSAVPPLHTDAPMVLKRRKPAASPVAVAQTYSAPEAPAPVPEAIDRMRDDDEDDYDEDEPTPPGKIELPATPVELPATPLASATDIPETPVVIRDFGVSRPTQRKPAGDDHQSSSRARVSVHALLS